MRAGACIALLLFVVAATAHAQADLDITSYASPSSGLVIDQEFLVTTAVRNNGPGAAAGVSGSIFLPQGEPFWFDFAGSATPGCTIEQFEIDPPAFLLLWSYAELVAGQERTCVVRLRVRVPPPDNTTSLYAHVDSLTADPVSANDDATLPIFFGSFVSTARHVIPSTSGAALALLAVGTLALAFFAWKRGMHEVSVCCESRGTLFRSIFRR